MREKSLRTMQCKHWGARRQGMIPAAINQMKWRKIGDDTRHDANKIEVPVQIRIHPVVGLKLHGVYIFAFDETGVHGRGKYMALNEKEVTLW